MKKLLPYSSKNPQGFTLIELLVVISIIAILSVMGMVLFGRTQINARNARRRSDVDAISKALEVHYNTTQNQFCTANAGTYCATQANWFVLGAIPQDPQSGAAYAGQPVDGAPTYRVCADLEGGGGTYCRQQQQ